MSGMIRKHYVGFLLCVILSGCTGNVHVYAAEAEIPNTPTPSEEQEYGILVVECIDGGGTIEVSCGDIEEHFNYDYYEMEIPLGKEVIITVHPYPVYEVMGIKFGDEHLKSEDGRYKIIMTEPYMNLCVMYVAASKGNTDENGSKGSEKIDNKVHHKDDVSEQGQSVSSISYEVVVTYLETENENVTDIPSVSDESDDMSVDTVDTNGGSAYEADKVIADNDIADAEAIYDTEEHTPEENFVILADNSESIESADADVKIEKDSINLEPTENNVARMEKIPVNCKEEFDNSLKEKEKSVLILSNFPLYLVLVCCMIIVKRLK